MLRLTLSTDDTIMIRLWISLLTLILGGCAIGPPLRDVGGGMPSSTDPALLVAVTEATLGDDRDARARFWLGVRRVEAAMPAQDGLVGYALRREIFGSKVWTMTVWRTEADLDRFVKSDAHRTAVREGYAALVGMRSTRFSWDARRGAPAWQDALSMLESADYL
jgi:heme-degrading monooxygenase HmoA